MVGVTAYVVAQEAPEPASTPEVAKAPEASTVREAEPAPSTSGPPIIDLSMPGESLIISSRAARHGDQDLESALDRIRSLVQVTLPDPSPLLPSPRVFSGRGSRRVDWILFFQ